MTNHAPITLTRHLHVDEQDEAVYLLQRYYAGLIAGNASGFEGGHWDGFDPSGTREASPDEFTADDLLAASLLSADPTSGNREDPLERLCEEVFVQGTACSR